MEKRTLLIIIAAIATVVIAVVVFKYMKLQAFPYQCPSGTCYANWGQDDPLKKFETQQNSFQIPASGY